MHLLSSSRYLLAKLTKPRYVLAIYLIALLLSFGLSNPEPGLASVVSNLNSQPSSLTNQVNQTDSNNKKTAYCPGICKSLVSHTTTQLSNGKILLVGGKSDNSAVNSAQLYDPATNAWSATANLLTARYSHTATLLPNGKVLVVGGLNSVSQTLNTSELYDPATNAWSTTASLLTTRYSHTATLLPNGKVLVVGGANTNSNGLNTAELYDPATNAWSVAGTLPTPRIGHTATLLLNGKVLVAGAGGSYELYTASSELYDPATNSWSPTGNMATPRNSHTATLLSNGKVLVAGGGTSSNFTIRNSEIYDPATGSWSATNNLTVLRTEHSATLLPNGKVVVIGGSSPMVALNNSEVYDPATGSWSFLGNLSDPRSSHSATLLSNGKILLVGGLTSSHNNTALSEVYDPIIGNWLATGSLNIARSNHTTTLLTTGKILVVGGSNNGTALSSSELYDPLAGKWTPTESLNTARQNHTTTLLPNGNVLVVGGVSNGAALASSELYDPRTAKWTSIASLSTARQSHSATLLPNGNVLVVGGISNGTALASSELYNSATNSWTSIASLNTARQNHTATLLPDGKILIVGGVNNGLTLGNNELYNPVSGLWTPADNLTTSRHSHTATLLADGKVLVAGGSNNGAALASSELYNPATNIWSPTANLTTPRQNHSATLLPNGKLLVIAGYNTDYLRSSEVYDPASPSWTVSNNLNVERAGHTTTLLPNGQLFVVGGSNSSGTSLNSTELYEQTGGKWASVGNFLTPRIEHTLTLLPNGKLLVVGGEDSSYNRLSSSELYDPATGVSVATGSLNTARAEHTAILLPNGKVLVAGGYNIVNSNTNLLKSSELYDPVSGLWSPTGNMINQRQNYKALLLSNGKVLVVGGNGNTGALINSSEIYDPTTEKWTATGNINIERNNFTVTLLTDGKVLLVGAETTIMAELYDPATGLWSFIDNNPTAHFNHTATLLPNGKVLVVGGWESGQPDPVATNLVEIYDPATGTWSTAKPLTTRRVGHTATLLPNGKVLVAGGNSDFYTSVDFEEIYDPASDSWTALNKSTVYGNSNMGGEWLLANGKVLLSRGLLDPNQYFEPGLQPQINSTTSQTYPGSKLPIIVEGTGFAGKSEASGGATNSSPTNYPVVKLQSFSNEQMAWLPVQQWSATSVTFTAPISFPLGAAFLTVYANGVPSLSKVVTVSPPISTATSVAYNLITPVIGDNIVFSATVTATEPSPVGVPTGSVAFKVNGVAVGSGALNSSGVATYTYSSPFTYTGPLGAEYIPSPEFQPSIASTIPFTINAPLPNPLALYPASRVLTVQRQSFLFTIRAEKVITDPTTGMWATKAYCLKPDGTAKMLYTPPFNPTTPDLIEALFNIECYPASPGIVKIYLETLAPGGGTSIALPFEFTAPSATNPVPTILHITPDYLLAGTTGNPQIAVSGQSISPGVSVYYNGQLQTITPDIDNQTLYFNLSAADLVSPGIGIIQLQNPTPGGGYSNVAVLKIIPATYNQPAITSLSPISITRGGPEFSLVVQGQNFYPNSQVFWNGSERTTTYYSSTLLLADIMREDIAQSGVASITVATVGQVSNSAPLEVVTNCLFNVVTRFEDGADTDCGTLRAAVKYTSSGGFGAAYSWGGGRQAVKSFILNAPLDMSKVSTFFPCGLDGKPQYEIVSKVSVASNQPAIRIDNTSRPAGALVPYLQGIRLRGTGVPLLKVQGPLKTGCLQVIK